MNYNIVVTQNTDKQSVMDLFDSITDTLVASDKLFTAEISDKDLDKYKANSSISFIEPVNNEITDD
tara:strand:+ start:77 stop:274 length:198 start_codon:yes stop_codon:yes gene_type:complete